MVLDIKPLPRDQGFKFIDEIKGGVVPRNFIPSVEEGVVAALKHGPLGFQVVDVQVKLIDGSYHTVDSSDMAFQLAGKLGVNEGLPQCQPVLLESIYEVTIVCPSCRAARAVCHVFMPIGGRNSTGRTPRVASIRSSVSVISRRQYGQRRITP